MDTSAIEAAIPRLRRYALALTRDRGRADDLVQDTLERALRKFVLWRRRDARGAWLFTVMHNVFINQVRAAHLDEVPLDAIDPAGHRETPDTAHDLEGALGRLPATQREVLLLVALEGFGYEEAARILEVPVGTVMSRLSRAREQLRRLLDGEPVTRLRVVK
jgi:RNA polymerase sigma-70 factor (ECF subfamily)